MSANPVYHAQSNHIDLDVHFVREKVAVDQLSHLTVKWAQRSDEVFITIELPDAQDVKLRLEPEGRFLFSATSGVDKITYEVDLDLHDKVDVDGSKAGVGNRNITYLVKKAESNWWNRLLKQEGGPPVFLKVDWDRLVDEDEEDQDTKPGPDMDFGGFDFSKMNMGDGEGFDAVEDDDVIQKMKLWKKYQLRRKMPHHTVLNLKSNV
ncbi:co-chaperone protein p23-1-like [Hibiscus syriacus]|uniref:co-chaperone protein p23-1-like n=1 Tax=Hibiscus syriacus TaxID=106335 RepID=UPI0019231276|nr:co-chaperone protein p23-1-like [Hibiscus syriacus]